ncbi:M14 family metallopeptidase [Porticoccaceae bacterium]|nr:M14 family metallopeptidase [Porticoccaceae bacterium]
MIDPFSHDVSTATETFVTACRLTGADLQTFEHPLRGPNGQVLHVSVGWIGPREADCVLLVVSGTHGAEGWAGSAIQIEALRNGVFDDLPENTAVMIIHLMNPWGCAWGRRENEDNCDLFRDFIYYAPSLRSDDSKFNDRIFEALILRGYSPEERRRSDAALESLLHDIREEELTDIMRAGQFCYPNAPCYNGGGISWSFALYRRLVCDFLSSARSVLCIDIHTAFGVYGEGILIPYYPDNEFGSTKLSELERIFPEQDIRRAGFDPAIPSHPRLPYEVALDFVPGLAMTSSVLEFGTYGWEDGLTLLKYMNYLFTYGDPNKPERPDLVQQYNRLCRPDESDWRDAVLAQGVRAIGCALESLERKA